MIIAGIPYDSPKLFPLLRSSVLGYGVYVGFIFKCFSLINNDGTLNKNDVEIGYPSTHETLSAGGRNVPLSTGSQRDTIVRTRSTLFAWAITTGFALPSGFSIPNDKSKWHVETIVEIKKQKWPWTKLKMFVDNSLFDGSHTVDRPLSYRWMTKSTKALRERGQENIRGLSMREENTVKNRRFAIVYGLALVSSNNNLLNYKKFVSHLSDHPDLFVINSNDFERVMQIEKEIAIVAGIPYSEKNEILKPLTRINLDYLKKDAPKEVMNVVEDIITKIN